MMCTYDIESGFIDETSQRRTTRVRNEFWYFIIFIFEPRDDLGFTMLKNFIETLLNFMYFTWNLVLINSIQLDYILLSNSPRI